MHGTIRSNGPLGRQLGWGRADGDLDVVSAAELRRRRSAMRETILRDREADRRARLSKLEDAWAARQRELHTPIAIPQRGVTIASMIAIGVDAFGVAEQEIKSARRHRALVSARQTVMWLCKRFATDGNGVLRSFPEIGRAMGGRDHTTVLHAVKKVDGVIARHGIDGGDTPAEWARLLAQLPPGAWGNMRGRSRRG